MRSNPKHKITLTNSKMGSYSAVHHLISNRSKRSDDRHQSVHFMPNQSEDQFVYVQSFQKGQWTQVGIFSSLQPFSALPKWSPQQYDHNKLLLPVLKIYLNTPYSKMAANIPFFFGLYDNWPLMPHLTETFILNSQRAITANRAI